MKDKEITKGLTIEPILCNRYILTFTEGSSVYVEPVRIQKISRNNEYHTISIIEIINEDNIFDKIKTGSKISYKIDLLDPIGKVVNTFSYTGSVENVSSDDLSYSNDKPLTTKLIIKIVE